MRHNKRQSNFSQLEPRLLGASPGSNPKNGGQKKDEQKDRNGMQHPVEGGWIAQQTEEEQQSEQEGLGLICCCDREAG